MKEYNFQSHESRLPTSTHHLPINDIEVTHSMTFSLSLYHLESSWITPLEAKSFCFILRDI